MTGALEFMFPVLREQVVCDNAKPFRSPFSRVALRGYIAKQTYAPASSAIQHTPYIKINYAEALSLMGTEFAPVTLIMNNCVIFLSNNSIILLIFN